MNARRRWSVRPLGRSLFAAAVIVCLAAFAANLALSDVGPSTRWGRLYGSGATAMLVVAVAYFGRRRAPRRGPGRAQTWLHWHVYGGALFLLLIAMHTAFRLPHGLLGWGLWLVSTYIVVTGAAGLLLQRWLPRMLSSAGALEVNYERIPVLVDELRQRAEALVATGDDAVQRMFATLMAPALAGPQPRVAYFFDPAGHIRTQLDEIAAVRDALPDDQRQCAAALQELVANKLEIDAHYTLQRALRWWPRAHVPLTLVLVVLVALHLFSVWYY